MGARAHATDWCENAERNAVGEAMRSQRDDKRTLFPNWTNKWNANTHERSRVRSHRRWRSVSASAHIQCDWRAKLHMVPQSTTTLPFCILIIIYSISLQVFAQQPFSVHLCVPNFFMAPVANNHNQRIICGKRDLAPTTRSIIARRTCSTHKTMPSLCDVHVCCVYGVVECIAVVIHDFRHSNDSELDNNCVIHCFPFALISFVFSSSRCPRFILWWNQMSTNMLKND